MSGRAFMFHTPILWIALTIVAVLQLGFLAIGVAPVADGGLLGPDSYMRLLRVEQLVYTGEWLNTPFVRANAPEGDILHWTRLFDVLIIGLAAPLSIALEWRQAMYWAGVLVSPVLQIATVFALFWGARAIFSADRSGLVAVIFICLPAGYSSFVAGRADHHSLQFFLFALTTALTIRLLVRPRTKTEAAVFGVVLGCALWVSLEALPSIALSGAVIAGLWIFGTGGARRTGASFALGLAGIALFALLIDPPFGGVWTAVVDRMSVIHVVGTMVFGLFWWIVAPLLGKSGPFGRATACVLFAAVAMIALLLAFPMVLGGPYGQVDPKVLPAYLDHVAEVRSLIAGELSLTISLLVTQLGPAAIGVPYLALRCSRRREGHVRTIWLYLLGGSLLFIVLSVYQLRWATYANILLSFAVVGALGAVLDRITARNKGLRLAFMRAGTIVVFCVGFALAAGLAGKWHRAVGGQDLRVAAHCPIARFADWAGGGGQREPTQRISANAFFGPELLYKSPHEVLATPYHRNAAGILAAHKIENGPASQAQAIARQRNVTWIMICPPKDLSIDPPPAGSLREAASQGVRVPWLDPVQIPGYLSPLRLYAVPDQGR